VMSVVAFFFGVSEGTRPSTLWTVCETGICLRYRWVKIWKCLLAWGPFSPFLLEQFLEVFVSFLKSTYTFCFFFFFFFLYGSR
jgi:hypothetical protein